MIALKKNLIFLCDKLSNIFDKEYITLVIKKIYDEAYSNIIKGILYFNIYIDNNDNVLISLEHFSNGRDDLDIKIIFHLENDLFYKLDDSFEIEDNTKIYYYDHNFYLKIDKFLEEEDIIKNIENYDISYGEDSFKIINDGILLKYKKVPY